MAISNNVDMTNTVNAIAQFRFFCQKVLPAVYDDSLSYYEVLCKIQQKLNEVIEQLNNVSGDAIEELQKAVMELEAEFNQFKESGFNDYYKEQVQTWINNNLEYIFDKVVQQVYFGITADGHFIAYIPESWNDIIFDTGFVYSLDTYGRLILRYNVDSVVPVNQTPEIVR